MTAENWSEVCKPASANLCAIAFLSGGRHSPTFEAELAVAKAAAVARRDDPCVLSSPPARLFVACYGLCAFALGPTPPRSRPEKRISHPTALSSAPFVLPFALPLPPPGLRYVFMWADGGCLTDFADAFDVQPSKLPTAVAYAPKKARYASFVGVFGEESVADLLTGVLSGRVKTQSLFQAVPAPDAGKDCAALAAAAAAGGSMGDGEPLVEDEDMGDMMAEILAEEARAKVLRQRRRRAGSWQRPRSWRRPHSGNMTCPLLCVPLPRFAVCSGGARGGARG